ncbi:HPr kinase/phosphorylase [Sphingomonas sp.]|uniref:HPr kinase/phosphorylase n=1 Tax=Sphingomonas sp. TaxID=28214 RepID=UPI000DB72758|nr:HPr kinase/phosphatase C-terminal domain-containing protein [Sphingomonas sp.]PZU08742.1 MAG: aldolase [Sphingomonas sp.]
MTSPSPFAILHATCVSIGKRGVLILGPSGSGKSDLALRLIDRGAMLISDDGVEVRAESGRAIASAPATIAGQLEVRGLGIVALPAYDEIPVSLCISLDSERHRMPPDPLPVLSVAGLPVPMLALDPFEPSAPIKVERGLALYGLPA